MPIRFAWLDIASWLKTVQRHLRIHRDEEQAFCFIAREISCVNLLILIANLILISGIIHMPSYDKTIYKLILSDKFLSELNTTAGNQQ